MYQKYVKPLLQNFTLPAIHLNGSQDWHTPALQLITNMLQTARGDIPDFWRWI